MMLTIGGFSLATKYQDIKLLIKQECKLNDFILDNLAVGPDGAKKVSVGVTDDRDGVVLMKRLNGFRLGGGVLRVEPVGKAQGMNQSQNYDQRGFQRDNQGQGYNRPTDQRFEPWDQSNHGNHGNQWSSNQQRQDFNYQQPGMTQEYRQPQQQAQRPGEQQRPGMRPVDQQRPSLRPIEPHRSDMRPMEQQRPGMRPDEQPRPGMRPDQQRPGMRPTDEQRPGMRPIEQDGPAMRPIEQRPAMRPMDQQNFTQGRGSNQFQQSGFPPKANNDMQRSDRTITLRSVELMDEPLDRSTGQQGGRYQQYDQQKPITIMKDNFQGPQYNMERQANFQGQAQGRPGQTAWNQAKPNPSYDRPYPDDKRVTKPMAHDSRFKPYDKDQPRFSPRDKEHVPRFSPRRDIPKDQHVPRFSPRRDVPKDPHVPRFSPRRDVPKDHVPRFSPRRDVPKEHNAPRFSPRRETGPRFSPRRDGKGPRFSPRRDGKEPRFSPRRDVPKDMHGTPRFSPRRDVRRESPVRRILSPGRRVSPADRRAVGRKRSPEDRARRDSPNRHVPRFSPNRRADKSSDKYPDASRAKDVRPAYEPPSQAPNQAMYSGGYRPTVHQNVQYPVPGRHPETLSPWHKEQGFPKDDDRRDVSRSKFVEAKRSPRKSRSPVRRERSPVRDRYKKSASPRSSMSPHRSWILEKRRSPEIRDAPPPPMWPGHKPDEQFRGRPHDRMEDDKGKRMPVWEGRAYDDKNDRRPEDDRRPNSSVRVRSDLQRQAQPNVPRREPSPRFKPEDRPKFEPRESRFDRPHETPRFEPREDPERRPDFRREDRPYRPSPEDDRRPRRDDYRRDDRKDIPVESEKFIKIDKEFEDIYKRAVEFNKKAQELRKREDYTDDRPGSKEYRKYDDRRDVRDERDYRDDRRHDERPTGSVPSKWDDWKPQDRDRMSPTIRAKRDKAVEELAQRIVDKHGTGFNAELKKRVFEEMKISLAKILKGIYGNQDVSFIEIVVKFNAKFNAMDEKKIFDDVMSSLPSHYRNMKRPVEEPVPAAVVPAKVARVAAPAVMPGYNRPQHKAVIRPETHKRPVRPQVNLKARPLRPEAQDRDTLRPVRVKPERIRPDVPRRVPVGRIRPDVPRKVPVRRVEKPKPVEEKREVVKSEAVKSEEPVRKKSPSGEPTPEGHFELNQLMSRMLDHELRQVMIKVWQELPDAPQSDAGKVVADRFRNAAGDDLLNALGLNVTKRLLNIHNSLFVKLHFDRKPDPQRLKAFLYEFKCSPACPPPRPPRAAADLSCLVRARSVADFDRLCDVAVARCGTARLTITPVYKFTHCPSKLKTIYKVSTPSKDEVTKPDDEVKKAENSQSEDKPTDKVNENAENVNDKSEDNVKDVSAENVKDISAENVNDEIAEKVNDKGAEKVNDKTTDKVIESVKTTKVTKTDKKPTVNEASAPKPVKTQIDKATTNTTIEKEKTTEKLNETDEVKTSKQNDATTVKKPEPKPTPEKVPATNTKVETKITNTNTKPTNAKVEAPAKAKVVTKVAPKTATPAKQVKPTPKTKPAQNEKKIQKTLNIKSQKTVQKSVNKTKVVPKRVTRSKAKNKVESDNDELDDADILAMMSEAIILDECGPDE